MENKPTEWRHLINRPSSIDFKDIGVEDLLIILWKTSKVVVDNEIPVEKSYKEMFSMAQQAIMNTSPFTYEFICENGNTDSWYFKKWIDTFYGKKIMTDFTDPRRMCCLWFDKINDKPNYMREVAVNVLSRRYQRRKIQHN